MQIIGIDVGTLSTKGLIINDTGKVLGRQSITHTVSSPHPEWAEQDGEKVWWAETVKVLHHLLMQPEVHPEEIVGIGISGHFPALLLADSVGKVLRPAILYSDNRAYRELSELNQEFGLELTGDAITPKLVWLRKHEPDVFRKAAYLFSSHNYVVFRLTGAFSLDYKVADALGGLLDRRKLSWREDVMGKIGISAEKLPNLCSPHEIAGRITIAAAKETGLPEGIPVIIGSGDSLLTLIGSGVVNRGQALLSIGTSGWLAVCPHDLEAYLRNPKLAAEQAPYLLEAYLLSCGSTLQWYLDQFGSSEVAQAENQGVSPLQILDEKATHISPGSNGLLVFPYFSGSRQNQRLEPLSGGVTGLTLNHSPIHFYRAFLESFGYILRSGLERLETRGFLVEKIVVTGGGAVSKVWRQILSDINMKSLVYYPYADPCLGSVTVTGYALGLWKSLDHALTWLPTPLVSHPDPHTHALYEVPYQRFIETRSRLLL
jgi:xylulokinase